MQTFFSFQSILWLVFVCVLDKSNIYGVILTFVLILTNCKRITFLLKNCKMERNFYIFVEDGQLENPTVVLPWHRITYIRSASIGHQVRFAWLYDGHEAFRHRGFMLCLSMGRFVYHQEWGKLEKCTTKHTHTHRLNTECGLMSTLLQLWEIIEIQGKWHASSNEANP